MTTSPDIGREQAGGPTIPTTRCREILARATLSGSGKHLDYAILPISFADILPTLDGRDQAENPETSGRPTIPFK